MKRRLPTASSLERVLECPASVVLPQIFAGVGEDAERGTAIGRFVRDVLAGEPFEASLERVPRPEWRATCAALDFRTICGDLVDVRAEVAYAVDPAQQTARLLGLNLGRQYPDLADGEFCGTNDLEGRTASGREVVCDLKSGREVTSCAVNPQLMFHALARWLVTGATEVEARILYVREDGRVFPDAHVFTAYELELYADALESLVTRIRETREGHAREGLGAIVVTEGRWCGYCPAYSACPAKTALARAMLPELRAVSTESMTLEEAGAAWIFASEAEKLARAVKDRLNDMARMAPLPTRPGKVVRETVSHSTVFAQGQAIALLREKGVTQAEIDCLFVETPTRPVREVNDGTAKPRKARAA